MSKKLETLDILLQIIVAAQGEPMSPVQLQKVAFLVGQECSENDLPKPYYDFAPYDYGPFCVDVYRDAERLQEQGLVSIGINSSGGWREYRATFQSRDVDTDLISKEVVDYIQSAVEWAMQLTFRQLVSSIYHSYPHFRENSIFNG